MLLIKGGTVIGAAGRRRVDVEVDGERISRVEADIPASGHEVIDAGDLLVLPGAIDAHTHMEWPGSADDFETGTRAAAYGGITTIVDFAIQQRGRGLAQTIADWKAKADPKVCVDYGLHLAISDYDDRAQREMAGIVEGGVTSFKMWMTSAHSGGLGVDDGTIVRVMEDVASLGALVGLHCENDAVIRMLASRHLTAGQRLPVYHLRSHPPFVEAEAVRRATTFAEAAGCPLYIPHLSSAAGRQAVLEGRARGARLVAETCPQFLVLTDEVYERPDAARFVMSPPIKGLEDQSVLWRGLREGDVATVGSDHCPYSDRMKGAGADDFTLIPNGVPGTEVLLTLLHSEGTARNRLTLEQLVAAAAENPARLFGMYPRKGAIAPGSDADVVLFDPRAEWVLDAEALHSNLDYSIYSGLKATGRPALTVLRGRIICDHGRFCGSPGQGHFVRRDAPDQALLRAAA
jgi:dihydropyrimidinase